MAKEKFERTKPHVNVGTNSATLEDTSGSLVVTDSAIPTGNDSGSTDVGASGLSLDGPASPSPTVEYTASVAFPIDTDFVFDPNSSGAAESIDFQFEVMSLGIAGADDVEISLAILQGEAFVFSRTGVSLVIDSADTKWTPFQVTDAQATEFNAVDGGSERPDFSRPFQFGYSLTSEYTNTALDVDLALDNMVVEITTIPEPTSLALVAAMGVSLLWDRLWRDDKGPT